MPAAIGIISSDCVSSQALDSTVGPISMIRIRPFDPDDLPRLRDLAMAAFVGVSISQGLEQLFGTINGHNWQWRKGKEIDADATADPSGVFVAVLADRTELIVGFITSRQDTDAGIGSIPNLVVAEDYRGQGLGRELILHVLQQFRDSGLTHARIETLAQNDAGNSLYRSVGFQEVARQIHFALDLRASVDDRITSEDTSS